MTSAEARILHPFPLILNSSNLILFHLLVVDTDRHNLILFVKFSPSYFSSVSSPTSPWFLQYDTFVNLLKCNTADPNWANLILTTPAWTNRTLGPTNIWSKDLCAKSTFGLFDQSHLHHSAVWTQMRFEPQTFVCCFKNLWYKHLIGGGVDSNLNSVFNVCKNIDVLSILIRLLKIYLRSALTFLAP